jgi:TolA-binding protein
MSTQPVMRLIGALVLTVAVAAYRQPGWAQLDSREAIALQNQILDLRRQVQALQDQSARGGGPTYLGRGAYPPAGGVPGFTPGGSSDLVAQLLARVDALEEEVRQLRGRTDETANQVQRMGADLSKRLDDQAFQSQNPQDFGQPSRAAPPSALPSPSPPSSGLALMPPPSSLGGAPAGPSQQPGGPLRRTPEIAMQEGNAGLARRDYKAAEQAAREVLSGSRTSPRAYDAQFLLAQALQGERQFPQAAIAYDDTYNRARKGAHAQDAMLGLANALLAINERHAACDTLAKFRNEFPSPRPDLRDAIGDTTQRAGCR